MNHSRLLGEQIISLQLLENRHIGLIEQDRIHRFVKQLIDHLLHGIMVHDSDPVTERFAQQTGSRGRVLFIIRGGDAKLIVLRVL